MANHITFVYHHEGRFERNMNGVLKYVGGEVTVIPRVNVETLNTFFMVGLFKDLGYVSFKDFYWVENEVSNGLHLIRLDSDVVRMYEFGIENERICHIYWDHIVDLPEKVEVVDIVDDESCPTIDTIEQPTPQETPRRRSEMEIHKKPSLKKLYVKKANKKNKINQSSNETQNPASPNPSFTTQPMSQFEIPNVNRNTTQQQSEAEVPPPNNSQFVQGGRNETPKIFVPHVEPDSSNSDDDSDSDPDYYQYESEDLHSPMSSDCEDDYDSE
ncbi:hypothetical protein AHAS_Ahas13G0381900 [Arachis hypogaea]